LDYSLIMSEQLATSWECNAALPQIERYILFSGDEEMSPAGFEGNLCKGGVQLKEKTSGPAVNFH